MESFRKSIGWALIIRGILFAIFGFLIIFTESKTIYGPMTFLGILLLVCGALYVVVSILLRKTNKAWYWGLIWGFADLFTGGFVMINIERAMSLFTIVISLFAILMGIAILVTAFYVNGYRIFLYINSAVSVVFGLLILFNPFDSVYGLNFLIALYALLFGLFLIYAGVILMKVPPKNDELLPNNDSVFVTKTS
ncbi:MAG: DUF308 domain-containing protein [Bacteroidia bacterium]|nr:DUF308 domain-containing protein [Bacteroidia bacterium]